MKFKTFGNRNDPAVLFFHAMGVTGESSEPVANYLQDRYFCILPTSTVYCKGQKYVSKADEVRQVEAYLKLQGVEYLELVVASSIGADLAMAFLTSTKLPIGHVFFDGGQFAQIGKGTRRMMTPFLYFAIRSLYWSKGGTLKKILWCDDDSIKSYFIAAGKNLTYTNLRRHILDSLEDKPFPSLPEELQKHIYFEFGSIEDHFKYRQAVMKAYPCGNYPVFEGYDHMQYQIRDPKGFAEMLTYIAEHDSMPKLPIGHVFFDGGQFAQIGKGTRRMMTPFLYLAIKSLYWSKGGTLKKILWCDDDSIKPYFIAAGENLTYTNLRRQLSDSLEDEPFPSLPEELQKQIYFEFGSIEDHFKYRQAVMEAYPCGHYPVFEGYNHMQYQIRDPRGFAEMLTSIAEHDGMPKLPFIRK